MQKEANSYSPWTNDKPLKADPEIFCTHHTVEIRDVAIFVGVRIEEHLSVGVNGYVSPHVFLVLA